MNKMMAPLVAMVLAAPAAAQDREAMCADQADMVMQVVAQRTDGVDAQAATTNVQGELTGDAARYAGVVPAVVDWVYTLEADKLGPQVGQSWTEACLTR